jgi:hypothetical protein
MGSNDGGENYNKESYQLPEVAAERKRLLTIQANMDAETYLSQLHFENPEAVINREPTENEVSTHAMIYNKNLFEQKLPEMNEQEFEIYELAFRARFVQGHKKTTLN